MPIEEQVQQVQQQVQQIKTISIAAVGLAGAAVIASTVAAWFTLHPALSFANAYPGDNRAHIESPITASGGSMTFRSQAAWNCSVPTGGPSNVSTVCIAQESIAAFSATHLFRADTNNNFFSAPSYGVGSGSESGTVTLYMRPQSGDPGTTPPTPSTTTTPYIVLCTSASKSYDVNCSGTNYIQIQVYNTTTPPTHAILTPSSAVEPTTSAYASQTFAVQYFDPACAIHGTSTVPIPSPIPACEHPGWVTWVDKQSYLCVHGLCSVSLDN